jgi:hypothetical protein
MLSRFFVVVFVFRDDDDDARVNFILECRRRQNYGGGRGGANKERMARESETGFEVKHLISRQTRRPNLLLLHYYSKSLRTS